MRFLLDTNVLSEPARPEPSPEVMKRLEKHRDEVCRRPGGGDPKKSRVFVVVSR